MCLVCLVVPLSFRTRQGFANGCSGNIMYVVVYKVSVQKVKILCSMIVHKVLDGANNPCLVRMRSTFQRRDRRVHHVHGTVDVMCSFRLDRL